MERQDFNRGLLERIATHLEAISDLFRPGAKITLLIRNPSYVDADVLITDDQYESIIASLKKRAEKVNFDLHPVK